MSYIYCFSDFKDIFTALSGVLFFLAGVKMYKINSFTLVDRTLAVLGGVSYIIYLGHNYFLWKWPEILSLTNSVMITGCVILGLTSIWLFFLFWANNYLNRWIVNPILARYNT